MTQPTADNTIDATSGPVLAEYSDRLKRDEIEPDSAQREAVAKLDRLAIELVNQKSRKSGLFSFISRDKQAPTSGLYFYGGVGRGKTMLMDLFFEAVDHHPKRRLHFHEFLAETHDRIAETRNHMDGDPIPAVAAQIAKGASLLCFDEMHVTDIADAMILSRLFAGLFKHSVVVVTTSNAHPGELYKDGLNRQLFLPFIDLIQQHMNVHEVRSSKDFRLEKLVGRKLYYSPVDAHARTEMDAHWERLTGHHPGAPCELEIKGRTLNIPIASMGIARFSFADLCATPLGSLDYLRIAHAFHTILIDDIPTLSPENRNEARRFINLVDTLYDSQVSLIASAEAEPDALYKSGDGADLFERTASRLIEMRSEDYLASRT